MEPTEVIIELANRLGIATKEIFEIYAYAIKGIAIIDAIGTIIFFVAMWLGIKKIYRMTVEYGKSELEKDEYSRCGITLFKFNDDQCGIFIAFSVVYGLFLFLFILLLGSALCQYLFPEYYAIEEMLSSLSRLAP